MLDIIARISPYFFNRYAFLDLIQLDILLAVPHLDGASFEYNIVHFKLCIIQ